MMSPLPATPTPGPRPSSAASVGLTVALSLTGVAAALGGSSTVPNTLQFGPGSTNHPVGVIPSTAVTVPSSWPVDNRGAITCLTCHADIPTSREVSGPQLRDFESHAPQAADFCARCHGETDQGSARSVHWRTLGVAHLPSDRTDPRDGGGVLDTRTRQCLSCHDGVSAPESTNTTPWARSLGNMGDKRRNHPIGVQYRDLGRPKDLSPLRPASLLPREVALPNGKVGCLSCHNLFAGGEYLLTVPTKGSELCLTCHDMR